MKQNPEFQLCRMSSLVCSINDKTDTDLEWQASLQCSVPSVIKYTNIDHWLEWQVFLSVASLKGLTLITWSALVWCYFLREWWKLLWSLIRMTVQCLVLSAPPVIKLMLIRMTRQHSVLSVPPGIKPTFLTRQCSFLSVPSVIKLTLIKAMFHHYSEVFVLSNWNRSVRISHREDLSSTFCVTQVVTL